MNVWFSSDFHMGHANIIEYANRPFKDVETMNEALIRNFNDRVKKNDICFHIGDFCFRNSKNGKPGEGTTMKAEDYLEKLNGHITFIKGNHDCFPLDTRILTITGYKKYSQIKVGDIIPTLNINKNTVELKPIKKIVCSIFNKSYKLRHWRFSKNHQLILIKHYKLDSINKKRTVSEMINSMSPIIMPISFKSGNEDYDISDNLIKVLAWIYTDANINDWGYVTIYQSKRKYVSEIKLLLRNLGLKYSIYRRIRKTKFICGKRLKKILPSYDFRIHAASSRDILNRLNIKTKRDLPEWLFKLSDKQMDIFLTEMLKANGTKTGSGSLMLYGRKWFLDKIMGLCVTHGRGASVNKGCGGYYLVLHSKRRTHNMNRTYSYKIDRKIINKKIFMWCVDVDNHNIFIEKNGKSLITGNSNNSLKAVIKSAIIYMAGQEIYLVHNPMDSDNRFKINLVGHVHQLWKVVKIKNTYLVNVGVDVNKFHPISINEILALIVKYDKGEIPKYTGKLTGNIEDGQEEIN